MNRRIAAVTAFVLILTATTICAIVYFVDKGDGDRSRSFQSHVTDFDSCMRAGNPIQESYPRRCSTADGRSYTEVIEPDTYQKPVENDLQTLNAGSYGLKKPSQKVITTQAELDKLWKDLQIQAGQDVLLKPSIDFNKQVVVGVFAGTKGSGGHSIKITSVTDTDYQYQVHVEEVRPGDNCVSTTSLTYPYHIVAYTYVKAPDESTSKADWRLPTAKDFKFVSTTRINNCYAD